MGNPIEAFQNITILTLVIGWLITIFWMVVGWRAMRAHEKLADHVEWLARQSNKKEQDSVSSIED